MYITGIGHEHQGPGTSLVQFTPPEHDVRGMGCSCGNRGMGLFESGIDFSSWGWQEWFAVAIGGYVITSMFFTTKRAARQAGNAVSSRVRKTRSKIGSKIAGKKL